MSHPLLKRLTQDRRLTYQLLVSTVFINLLALASPVFSIQVLTRYITNGVTGTLVTLFVGVMIAIFLEFLFRLIRLKLATAICLHTDQLLADKLYDILNNMKFSRLNSIAPNVRRQVRSELAIIKQAYSSTNTTTALDVPFSALFIGLVYMLNVWLGPYFNCCCYFVVADSKD